MRWRGSVKFEKASKQSRPAGRRPRLPGRCYDESTTQISSRGIVLRRRGGEGRGREGSRASSAVPFIIIAARSPFPIYARHSVPGGSSSPSRFPASPLPSCASDPLISGLASPPSALPDPAIGGTPLFRRADPGTTQPIRRPPPPAPADRESIQIRPVEPSAIILFSSK